MLCCLLLKVKITMYLNEILQCSWPDFYPYRLYSWLSLSRTRLSRITAYLEVKFWSLPKHENLTTGKNIVEKTNFSSFQYISNFRSNFSSFHNIFNISLTSRVQLHTIYLLNVAVRLIVFLTSATLICRGTDISKCFRVSLGIRDNENRLYCHFLWDHWTHCGIFENENLLMYMLEGVSSVANFITCLWRVSIKPSFPFSICSVFFVSKGILLDFYSMVVINP